MYYSYLANICTHNSSIKSSELVYREDHCYLSMSNGLSVAVQHIASYVTTRASIIKALTPC